jgi:hypothetical protein
MISKQLFIFDMQLLIGLSRREMVSKGVKKVDGRGTPVPLRVDDRIFLDTHCSAQGFPFVHRDPSISLSPLAIQFVML